MSFINDNNDISTFQTASCSFSSFTGDETFMSLLRGPPLQSFDAPASSDFPSHLPMSFEDPFRDQSLEPLPIGTPDLVPPLVQSMPQNKNREEYLIDMLDVAIDLVGPSTKRNYDNLLCNTNQGYNINQGPSSKRQRASVPMQTSTNEESVARFRPYQEEKWQTQFKKLIQYKLANGHCCVPHSYPQDPILARWVKRQRYQYNKFKENDPAATMTTHRIQELESIGFVWHSHAAAWQEKLNELKFFKLHSGHCNVPSHFPQNPALSTWVKCQRRQYKLYILGKSSSTMAMKRFQELDSLGFVFDMRKSKESQRND